MEDMEIKKAATEDDHEFDEMIRLYEEYEANKYDCEDAIMHHFM